MLRCRVSMERLERGEMWSLFDPSDVPGLGDVYGTAFVKLYERYEKDRGAVARVPCKELWNLICDARRESGTPISKSADCVGSHLWHCVE